MRGVKTITGALPWTDKRQWIFPADDSRMDKSFREGPGDLDTAIPMLLPHLTGRRTCIQAGGCVGIWPLRLAQFFERVLTFEPEPTNYYCLTQNTAHLGNVTAYAAALGNDAGVTVTMQLEPAEAGNSGAYYVSGGGSIAVVRIDDLELPDVDLIYLDIEGSEADALLGAAETIRRCRPVIGVEDKQLNTRLGARNPVELLKSGFGYVSVGRPFSLDEILRAA